MCMYVQYEATLNLFSCPFGGILNGNGVNGIDVMGGKGWFGDAGVEIGNYS